MSNLKAFFEKVDQDPDLQSRIQNLKAGSPENAVSGVIALSEEIALPITVAELNAVDAAQCGELSEAELGEVAGGHGVYDYENIHPLFRMALKVQAAATPLAKDVL